MHSGESSVGFLMQRPQSTLVRHPYLAAVGMPREGEVKTVGERRIRPRGLMDEKDSKRVPPGFVGE
jgi:hypothetical protein